MDTANHSATVNPAGKDTPPRSLTQLLQAAHQRDLNRDELAAVNAASTGLEALLGVRWTYLGPREARAEVELTGQLHQPFGATHGGTYAALAESVGSAASVAAAGRPMVGVNNSTDFLRPTSDGVLEARAVPCHLGRRTHLWEVTLTHDGRVVAVSRLRTMALDG